MSEPFSADPADLVIRVPNPDWLRTDGPSVQRYDGQTFEALSDHAQDLRLLIGWRPVTMQLLLAEVVGTGPMDRVMLGDVLAESAVFRSPAGQEPPLLPHLLALGGVPLEAGGQYALVLDAYAHRDVNAPFDRAQIGLGPQRRDAYPEGTRIVHDLGFMPSGTREEHFAEFREHTPGSDLAFRLRFAETPDPEMRGTPGDDIIIGMNGIGQTIRGRGGNDTVTAGTGDDTLLGGDGDDWLIGGDGDDLLRGGPGNDILEGGEGNDTLSGGAGDDRLDGGPGDDLLRGRAGNDLLDGGEGDDVLHGGAGDDWLMGGAGDDLLRGGVGADTLEGGAGNDTLTGGPGADSFVFFPGHGDDVITDFGRGPDRLLLAEEIWGGGKSVAEMLADHAREVAEGTLLDFGSSSILLLGVADPQVLLDDIAFV